MDTSSAPPVTIQATVGRFGFFSVVSSYVKHHEWLIAIALGAALVWGVSGKIQDVIYRHDTYTLAAADAQAKAAAAAAQDAAQNVAGLKTDFAAFKQQSDAERARLEQANTALAAALRAQQAKDAALPPQELATRAETLSGSPTGSVVPAANDTFTVLHPALAQMVGLMDAVPSLQGQLRNTQTEADAGAKLLAAQDKVVQGLNGQVASLQGQVKADDAKCDARIKVERDKAAKAKRKWFVVGAIVGGAARGAVKIFLGY